VLWATARHRYQSLGPDVQTRRDLVS